MKESRTKAQLKQLLLAEMKSFISEQLQDERFMSKFQLERRLKEEFKKRLASYQNKIVRNGKEVDRTEAENLIDWVKAHLTKGRIPDVSLIGEFYFWLPIAGSIREENSSFASTHKHYEVRATLSEFVAKSKRTID